MKTTIRTKRLIKSDIIQSIHNAQNCQKEVITIIGSDPIMAQLCQAMIHLKSAQELISEIDEISAQDHTYRKGYL